MLGQEAWSLKERFDRFEEFVTLSDRLLREPETTYAGLFYSADEARTYPGCVQQPRIPFAIAGTGKRGMTLAAEFGQLWITNGDRSNPNMMDAREGAAVVKQQMQQLESICAAVGRDPKSLDRLVLTGPRFESGLESADAFQETVGTLCRNWRDRLSCSLAARR